MRTLSFKARSARAMGVVDEVELAFSRRNRLATALGVILGGVIPVATYVEAHLDLDPARPLYAQPTAILVMGGLLFSAKTVFAWGQRAFRDPWKAAGFVVLLEGVMITSDVPVLPLVLLGILVAINGIATGCTLSLDRSSARRAVAGPSIQPALKSSRRSSERVAPSSALVEVVPPSIIVAPRTRRRSRGGADTAQNRFDFASDASWTQPVREGAARRRAASRA